MSLQQTYKRSFAGSVGAGLGSVFNAGGKSYYILEHKVSSKYHKAGEAQEIIVDQIEIGRDSKCQVQFDDNFHTVSRRHAAIVRDGENWKLVQLSQTNKTFLNGRPVANEWYLQNGDEIQLSVNGPKLGFIIPSGNKAKTGSIALSRRLSLFRQQALKPYKTAMAIMATMLVLLLGAGITWGVLDHKRDLERAELTDQQIKAAKQKLEEANRLLEEQRQMIEKSQKDYKNLQKELKDLKTSKNSEISNIVSSSNTSNKAIASCEPSVYFIVMKRIEIIYQGEKKVIENVGSGTGFLLNDGRFITARHVVEPWMFPESANDEVNLLCNVIAHNGGSVVCYLEAYSPIGKRFSFKSTDARVNRSKDESSTLDGMTIKLAPLGSSDYAYFNTNEKSGLPYDNALSKKLPMQAKLTILGYPLGLGVNSATDIRPIYSEAVVAQDGLQANGNILTTATTFEHGNSGGPVFATTTDGELIVIGIVSAGAGRSTGFVVPISAVK